MHDKVLIDEKLMEMGCNIPSMYSLCYVHTETFNSFVRDLIILKKSSVNIHAPKAPIIKEIIWKPPYHNWRKCNIDGASNPTNSSCGSIFRDSDAIFKMKFAENIGGGLHSMLNYHEYLELLS